MRLDVDELCHGEMATAPAAKGLVSSEEMVDMAEVGKRGNGRFGGWWIVRRLIP